MLKWFCPTPQRKKRVYFFFVWNPQGAENIWIACLKLHNNSPVLYLAPSCLRVCVCVCVCVCVQSAAVVMGIILKDWQSISTVSPTHYYQHSGLTAAWILVIALSSLLASSDRARTTAAAPCITMTDAPQMLTPAKHSTCNYTSHSKFMESWTPIHFYNTLSALRLYSAVDSYSRAAASVSVSLDFTCLLVMCCGCAQVVNSRWGYKVYLVS